MATIKAQAPDGKTLSIDVPDGTDPSNYDSIVNDAVGHYSSSNIGQQQAPQIEAGQNGPGGYAADAGINPASMPTIDLKRSLLTNEAPANIGETILRGVPAALGSMAGAGAGLLAGGPLAAIGGAGLGAASMESARQGAAQIYAGVTGSQFTPLGTAIKDIAVQGLMNAAGEGIGQGLAALRPAAINFGAAAMRSMGAVPESSGKAALSDLSLIGNAPSSAEVSANYDAFHQASGTVSRKEYISGQVDPVDTAERAMGDMKEIWAKAQSGQQLTTQELVNGSQAARVIRDAKATGNEFARSVSDAADDMKSVFDQHIELRHPEWQAARQSAWENNVASDFTSPVPLNKNGSANQLRGYLSIKSALGGAATGAGGAVLAAGSGHPFLAAGAAAGAAASLLSPLMESPAAYGAAIKTAAALTPIAKAAAMGFRFALGSLAAYYNSPGASIPENDPEMSTLNGLRPKQLPPITIGK